MAAPAGTLSEEQGLVKAEKDDLVGAHTWKPIKRSFLRSSPLENSGCVEAPISWQPHRSELPRALDPGAFTVAVSSCYLSCRYQCCTWSSTG